MTRAIGPHECCRISHICNAFSRNDWRPKQTSIARERTKSSRIFAISSRADSTSSGSTVTRRLANHRRAVLPSTSLTSRSAPMASIACTNDVDNSRTDSAAILQAVRPRRSRHVKSAPAARSSFVHSTESATTERCRRDPSSSLLSTSAPANRNTRSASTLLAAIAEPMHVLLSSASARTCKSTPHSMSLFNTSSSKSWNAAKCNGVRPSLLRSLLRIQPRLINACMVFTLRAANQQKSVRLRVPSYAPASISANTMLSSRS
jgi:hypothetical protein